MMPTMVISIITESCRAVVNHSSDAYAISPAHHTAVVSDGYRPGLNPLPYSLRRAERCPGVLATAD